MQANRSLPIIELDRLYSVSELKNIIGCSHNNLVKHIQKKHLSSIRVGIKLYGVYGHSVRKMYEDYRVEPMPFKFI